MILLVDIGNSRIKWAPADGGGLGESAAEAYDDDTLAGVLDARWRGLAPPEAVFYCCVGASAAGAVLEDRVGQIWKATATRVRTAASGYGVRCAYDKPETLGADRWAALVGAWHRHRKAACIVDCGTAITLDALSGDGVHLGGVILPGVDLMRHALSARTDGIPPEVVDETSVFAASTPAGMGAGTMHAAAAGVDRIAKEMRSSLPVDSVTLLTGGDAARLAPLLSMEFVRDPDLVLFGLAVIAGAIR